MKEKIFYQWQVLGWRGVACDTGDGTLAVISLLCGVGGLILTWSENIAWKSYEEDYYKRAESGGENDYE